MEEVIVRSATEIYQVLDRGTVKRRTAATLLNNRSSRSHSIFTITIHLKARFPAGGIGRVCSVPDKGTKGSSF